MEVDDGQAAATLTAEQVIETVEGLPADDDASSTVSITQSWQVGFEVADGEDAAALAAQLEAACQATSPGCTLVASRRRALQSGGTTAATHPRSAARTLHPRDAPPHPRISAAHFAHMRRALGAPHE